MNGIRVPVGSGITKIGGVTSDLLRDAMSNENCILRRSYDAATGKAELRWLVIADHVPLALSVHDATVQRWKRHGWVEISTVYPTCFAPDTGTEFCVFVRCEGCKGIGLDLGSDWLCQECQEDDEST